MIVSYDTIILMKPPYEITPLVLNLCSEITLLLGKLEGLHISKPEPKLRKSNRVRTIQASLAIEGNTLELGQITAILEGKKVLGTRKEILEVHNAVNVYNQMMSLKPFQTFSFLKAHLLLMKGLIPDAGQWRSGNVGIFHGDRVAHAAPQAKRVPELMNQLFSFAKTEKQIHPLVLSALFHYEVEFIHPFSDGNGRMGRLWQSVILSHYHPFFEFTPVESVVKERQSEYYNALGNSDKKGSATPFIEFSLATIQNALESLLPQLRQEPMTAKGRLDIARNFFAKKEFSRKDYLSLFKTISTATASRDLVFGIKEKELKKTGDRALTRYRFV